MKRAAVSSILVAVVLLALGVTAEAQACLDRIEPGAPVEALLLFGLVNTFPCK